MALGATEHLTELNASNLPGVKGRAVLKVENLTAVSRLARKCVSLDVSQPCRPPRPVTGIALLYGDGVCFL
jgi:hypothetical protein